LSFGSRALFPLEMSEARQIDVDPFLAWKEPLRSRAGRGHRPLGALHPPPFGRLSVRDPAHLLDAAGEPRRGETLDGLDGRHPPFGSLDREAVLLALGRQDEPDILLGIRPCELDAMQGRRLVDRESIGRCDE
jgi:hypothetical protein